MKAPEDAHERPNSTVPAASGPQRRAVPRHDPQHDRVRGGRRRAARAPRLRVELRSVNHRYLDLTLKLPDELRGIESALRERIAAELKRGKVECRVAIHRLPARLRRRSPSMPRASPRSRRRGRGAPPRPGRDAAVGGRILRWPGVIVEAAVPADELVSRVHALVDRALAELAASRAREGDKLASLLEARCTDIEAQVGRVAPRIPAIHAAYVEKLGARLKEAGLDPNEDRMKQELALFATKVDVAEEVARLITHVAEVRRVLGAGGSAGKRLDFLAQELHREANTLGSKSVDAELSQAVARAQGGDRADAGAGAEHRVAGRRVEGRGRHRRDAEHPRHRRHATGGQMFAFEAADHGRDGVVVRS